MCFLEKERHTETETGGGNHKSAYQKPVCFSAIFSCFVAKETATGGGNIFVLFCRKRQTETETAGGNHKSACQKPVYFSAIYLVL